MTPQEHRDEAERLLEQAAKICDDYVALGKGTNSRKADLAGIFVMVTRRAQIHTLLSQGNRS
jgi:hypothetical protein